MNLDHIMTGIENFGMALELSLDLSWIGTVTLHNLRCHPTELNRQRGLVYIIHDEWELIYIGSTKRTLNDRLDQHIANKHQDMIGPWDGRTQPKKVGYWLKKRESFGSIDFWITTIPMRQVFSLSAEITDVLVNVYSVGLEVGLINKMHPLLNGTGPVEVLRNRYARHELWEPKQFALVTMLVRDQCARCLAESKQRDQP